MIYESLTGKPAFDSKTMYSLLREVISKPLQPIESKVDGLSPDFSEFVNRLIEPDPENRTQTADEALDQLKSVDEVAAHDRLDTPTITIQRAKPLKRPRKKSNTRYLGFAAISATVILFVAILTFNRDSISPSNNIPDQQSSDATSGSPPGLLHCPR